MESGITSSFIPSDASVATSGGSGNTRSGFGQLMLLVSIVLLVASLALAGGVYLYKQYLDQTSASKAAALQAEKDALDPKFIQQVSRLDDRMHAAESILNSHTSLAVFFNALQQSVLTTIAFQTLTLQTTDQKHITIQMTGVAQSVNSIALQASIFSKSGLINDPIFSGINRSVDGVHFNLAAIVDPAAINYVAAAGAAAQAQSSVQQAQQAPAQQAPSSPFTGGTVSGSSTTQ